MVLEQGPIGFGQMAGESSKAVSLMRSRELSNGVFDVCDDVVYLSPFFRERPTL